LFGDVFPIGQPDKQTGPDELLYQALVVARLDWLRNIF
jgi:hypothetical protein